MEIIHKYTSHLLLALPIIFVALFFWNEKLYKKPEARELNIPVKASIKIINLLAIAFAMASMVITYLELKGTASEWQLIPGKTAWVFTLICLDIAQTIELVARTIAAGKPKRKFLYNTMPNSQKRTI